MYPSITNLWSCDNTAPTGSVPPRGGGGTGGACIEPPNQHRTVCIAPVAPALLGGGLCLLPHRGNLRLWQNNHKAHANSGLIEHVNSKENPCPASSKCVNCQGDHPAYSRGCPKWKIEKKVQEIKVTQAVTFPEARRIAEGLVGQPTYANVSKISLQQSQPSNNPKQSVHTAQTSADTTQAGPRSTPYASHGPSRSSPTGPRSTPQSSI